MMKKSFKNLLKIAVAVLILCVVALIICLTVFADDRDESFVNKCDKHTAEIIGANVAIDKDISLRYYVKLCDCYKNAKMIFSSNGKSLKKAAYYDEENEEYVYTLGSISPEVLGEYINAELVCDGEVIATKENYSVLEYCKNMLEIYKKDENMQFLLRAVINYGAASQSYKDYKADDMINRGFEMDFLRPSELDSVKAIENNGGDADVKSANIMFDSENKIFVKIQCEYEPTVMVDGVQVNGVYEYFEELWYFYTDGITPDNYDKPIIFFVTSNDPTTVLTYSINSYLYSMMSNQKASMRSLAMALYTYGIAVDNYLAAIG